MTPRNTRSTRAPYASPLPTISPPRAGRRSRLAEEDFAEEGFGLRPRVVRVDAERQGLHLLPRRLAVDPLVVLTDVAGLGEPLAEVRLPRAHYDVGDEARLLALEGEPGRRRRVPDVADHPRAHGGGEPGKGHVHLSRLVVGGFLAGVRALGKADDLPGPLQDGIVLAVDLDLLVDGGAVAVAQHAQDVGGAVVDHLEVVPGAAPALRLPARGHALRAHWDLGPVLHHQLRPLRRHPGGD